MSEAQPWPVSIVGSGMVDPRTVVRHPRNPKTHPPEQQAVVGASLRQFGWLRRLLINRRTGHLLDGESRLDLALSEHEGEVPADYVDVPEEQEGAVLLTLDASAALAKPQLERWAALRTDAQARTQEPALQAFWAKLAKEHGVQDAEPPYTREGKTQTVEAKEAEVAAYRAEVLGTWPVETGQVWQCGRHRVVCGDCSGAPAIVARLLGSEVVDLVVTSPPYAVEKAYEAGGGVAAQREVIRTLGVRCQAVVRPGGFVVVNFAEVWAQKVAAAWTGSARACLYPMSREYWDYYHDQLGWDLYAARAWVKPFAKLRQPLWTYHTSLAHQQEWEHVWTWRLPGGGGEQVYDWDVSVHAVWDSGNEWLDPDGGGPWQHWSAGFPQYIPRQVLKAHSAAGALVWEPFLGSGTTLLACEALGRRCVGSDQDPGAVAVTLQRFYAASGERPRRVAEGARRVDGVPV